MMPYVNIKLAGEITKEQKEQISKEITEVIARVTGKNPDKTYIVIEEVPREDWAVGGKMLG